MGVPMKVRSFSSHAFLLIAFLMSAFAQAPVTGLQGKVTDQRNGGIAFAIVEITGPLLPDGKSVHSDKSGQYTCTDIPAGTYTVSVVAQGYRLIKRSRVRVQDGKLTTFNAKLKVDRAQNRRAMAMHSNCILCHPLSTEPNPKAEID